VEWCLGCGAKKGCAIGATLDGDEELIRRFSEEQIMVPNSKYNGEMQRLKAQGRMSRIDEEKRVVQKIADEMGLTDILKRQHHQQGKQSQGSSNKTQSKEIQQHHQEDIANSSKSSKFGNQGTGSSKIGKGSSENSYTTFQTPSKYHRPFGYNNNRILLLTHLFHLYVDGTPTKYKGNAKLERSNSNSSSGTDEKKPKKRVSSSEIVHVLAQVLPQASSPLTVEYSPQTWTEGGRSLRRRTTASEVKQPQKSDSEIIASRLRGTFFHDEISIEVDYSRDTKRTKRLKSEDSMEDIPIHAPSKSDSNSIRSLKSIVACNPDADTIEDFVSLCELREGQQFLEHFVNHVMFESGATRTANGMMTTSGNTHPSSSHQVEKTTTTTLIAVQHTTTTSLSSEKRKGELGSTSTES
jgi:hypothetical protein